jgi:AcrR family transcriptional regulator
MAEEATDRRVRRTRQLLREALMELTLERGYDHITVQDILDRADVGRSTFYAHYRDKDDLLVSEFEAMHPDWTAGVDGSAAEPGRRGELLEPLRVAFLQAGANRRQFKAMIGRQGSETIRRLLPEPVSNLVREHIRSQFPEWTGDEQQLAAGVQFIVGGFLGTLTWWLDTDAPYTADEIFEACRRLIVDGASAFFGPAQPQTAPPAS